MNKEIELKFGINGLPDLDKYENIKIYRILQNYIYQDTFSAIRVRKILDEQNKTCEYIYTVKTKGNIKNNNSVYEIETNISKEEYESLYIENGNNVEKLRIKIPLQNNLIAEMDLYYGKLEGLITVEVEFKNEDDLNNFVQPAWFGNKLDKKIFSNVKLSKMSRNEFLDVISKEELEQNMKMKTFIEKYI